MSVCEDSNCNSVKFKKGYSPFFFRYFSCLSVPQLMMGCPTFGGRKQVGTFFLYSTSNVTSNSHYSLGPSLG